MKVAGIACLTTKIDVGILVGLHCGPVADFFILTSLISLEIFLFSLTSSLNPLFLISSSSPGRPLISHSISPATAVQMKFAVLLTTILVDFGGIIIPCVSEKKSFLPL